MKELGDHRETFLILRNRNGLTHSIDIAAELNISKASVSVAMKKLQSGSYVRTDENHAIRLTRKGSEYAESIYKKHLLF